MQLVFSYFGVPPRGSHDGDTPHREEIKQQESIFHGSGGWEFQDQDATLVTFGEGLSSYS